jgi:hypothetical protein
MKFGGTKSFWAVFVVFLILVWSSMGQTQKQQDCPNGRGGGNPSWFNPGKNCNYKQKPYHYYERDIYLNQEQRGCNEVILVCGTMIVRDSVVARDPGCGGAFWPDPKDGDEVCCEEFQKAVKSKQPCDPSKDADCDGIANEDDSNPFKADPLTDAATDRKCAQLGQDVYNAYLTAGADKLGTALPLSRNARYDCMMRIAKEKCPTIAWEPPNDYHGPAKYPQDPDPDHKCAQLGQAVYEAYLKAGANTDTATYAAEIAREYCRKSRASKLRS